MAGVAGLRNRLKSVVPYLRLNFYRLHLLYFILTTLVSSTILYGANTSGFHVRYIDALFLCASALCNVGLSTVNLGSLNGLQQSVLFVLMPLGDITLVNISVVVIRRYYFRKDIKEFLERSEIGREVAEDIERQASWRGRDGRTADNESTREAHANGRSIGLHVTGHDRPLELLRSRDPPRSSGSPSLRGKHSLHVSGYGAFPAPWEIKRLHAPIHSLFRKRRSQSSPDHHYLSFHPVLDGKGRFRQLTLEQERELGGVEYRALKLLSWLLPTYSFAWILLAIPGNLNPAWWSVFVSFSAFANCGLSLLNASMIPLADKYLILVATGAAILGGNTLYPVFLRLIIWTLSKIVPKHSSIHHSLSFLLHHPRRCYLLLFPCRNTWYLLGIQVGINLTAWVLWIVLQIHFEPIDPGMPAGRRVIDGLYQAHSLRASGFSIISISSLAPALQIFYLAAMYISAFPIIMSLRQTNIYEERSLGYTPTKDNKQASEENDKNSRLGTHIRNQLAYDIWWLILAVFFVSIVERPSLHPYPSPKNPNSTPDRGFSLFSIIFEVVSAYGTVGFSLGVPYDDYSFCGVWRSVSKLILIAVMLRGRHRILPLAIDRAVLLPGQELMERLDRETNGSDVGREWVGEDERVARERELGKRLVREKEQGEEVESEGHKDESSSHSGSQDEEQMRELTQHEDVSRSSIN